MPAKVHMLGHLLISRQNCSDATTIAASRYASRPRRVSNSQAKVLVGTTRFELVTSPCQDSALTN